MPSAIDTKYQAVIKTNPWIGKPVGPELVCADKVGRYRDYEGGASIYYTPRTGAHLIYGLIRKKWFALGKEKSPNGYPISDEENAGSGRGRYNNFQNGTIIWKSGTFEAFSVYGAIYGKWGEAGYDQGAIGFPICDESSTICNQGRYNDFERGAVYYNSKTGTHVVRSPILEAWTLAGREQGMLKLPIGDSVAVKGSKNTFSQVFQGGNIICSEIASRALYSPTTKCRISSGSRSAVLTDSKNVGDNRSYELKRLNHYLKFKTALVIFRGSYTRILTDAEIDELKNSYATAARKVDEATFGLARIDYTPIIIESTLTKSDFADYNKGSDPNAFQAEFRGYPKVIQALQSHGLSVDNFDIVSINIPWVDTKTDKPSGFAWANTSFMLGNSKTWSSVQHIYPGDYWWAYFMHEMFHSIEWMLESKGYAHLRNPDDKWWADTYPKMTDAKGIVPTPMNMGEPGEYLLYAMYSRIKEHWFDLAPTWGEVVDTDIDSVHGSILMYSSPNPATLVETSVRALYFFNFNG